MRSFAIMVKYIPNFFRYVALICCSIYLCPLASAQDSLTLESAISIGINNNLAIKRSIISEKIANVQLSSARADRLPTIAANVNNNISSGRALDPYTNSYINTQFKTYTANLNGDLILFSGFSKLAAVKAAKKEVEINNSAVKSLINETTIEIASCFTTILYQRELIYANTEQVKTTQSQLVLAKLKYSQGYISESDVFKIESQKASEEVILINNQNLYNLRVMELKQLLNISQETRLNFKLYKNNQTSLQLTQSNIDSLIKIAVSQQPAFQQIKLIEQRLLANIQQDRAALYPTLSMRYNYGSLYSDRNPNLNFNNQLKINQSFGLNFVLSVPIFNKFQNSLKVKEMKFELQKSRIDSEIEYNRLSKVIHQAYNDTKSAYQRYLAAQAAYNFSLRSFNADTIKFEYGKISVSDLNISKNNFNNSNAELVKSKFEYLFNSSLVNFYFGENFKY